MHGGIVRSRASMSSRTHTAWGFKDELTVRPDPDCSRNYFCKYTVREKKSSRSVGSSMNQKSLCESGRRL